ncbi:MAG: CinA family protein [Planctomycetales bacterium]|nr:CinA family protein [Planctomycetales bacterium]
MAVALQLLDRELRVVLAESCTAGNVAASLACIPGISRCLCGSFVVYRCDSKSRWLSVPELMLDNSVDGPVSERVTQQMAWNALRLTPEADISIAVTGELGPGVVPVSKDGLVYISIADASGIRITEDYRLKLPTPGSQTDFIQRKARRDEATQLVLRRLGKYLIEN